MSIKLAVLKQTEPPIAGRSRPVQNAVADKAVQKPTIRTRAELKRLVDRVLLAPQTITRDEYAQLISAIGYPSVLRLMEQGKQRQPHDKKEQLKELGRTVQGPAAEKDPQSEKTEKQQQGTETSARANTGNTKPSATLAPISTENVEKSSNQHASPEGQQNQVAEDEPKPLTPEADVKLEPPLQKTVQPQMQVIKGMWAHHAISKRADVTPAGAAQSATQETAGEKHTAGPPATAENTGHKAATPSFAGENTATTQNARHNAATPTTAAGNTGVPTTVAPKVATAQKTAANEKAATTTQKTEVDEAATTTPKAAVHPKGAASEKTAPTKIDHESSEDEASAAPATRADQPQAAAQPATPAEGSLAGEAVQAGAGAKNKESAQPKTITIKAENPGSILEQLGSIPPTEVVNTFNQAVSVSGGALEKQRQKTQATLPTLPVPTGLPAGKSTGTAPSTKAAAAVKPNPQPELARFKSEKKGGSIQTGMPAAFPSGFEKEEDPDAVMAEARAYAANAPKIGMTGEADPSQVSGFQTEASQQVQAAKQAELSQTQQDFGENQIMPKPDPTVLKAGTVIRGVLAPKLQLKSVPGIPPEVAARINPSLSASLASYMATKKGEYQKGQATFDSGLTTAKTDSTTQIENLKTEATAKQRQEQAAAKAEVKGHRSQWQSEINQATAEHAREASTATTAKKREVDSIKQEKEGEVKKTLNQAEKDAGNEYKTTKTAAEEKKKAGEKESEQAANPKDNRNIFQKAGDFVKEKAQQAIEGLKKAVNFLFTQLRKAVKGIFDKAKAAAVGLIEKGRKLIVSAIQGLGTVLKGLVNKVFARFPGIAKKLSGLIDRAVNKAVQTVNQAASVLKQGVTAALSFMGKTLDTLLTGAQSLFNGVLSGIGKFLSGDFKVIFGHLLEGAQIAAEIAAAFVTGGGSILLQIVKWIATTLPQLFRQASSVMGFVNTLRNLKLEDVKPFLNPAGLGGFLVKGLFGEMKALPQGKQEGGDKEKAAAPEGGREEKGLMKVLQQLLGVFNVLQGTVGKVAGGINKILPVINISGKAWFNPFSMIYAGAVQALELVQNPGEALNEGAGKLKEAASSFFTSIKTKVSETAGSIKEKVMLLGKPAQLMKLIANKAVDMVLNFIITHPPSALIKAVFKGIEAAAGKSIVELVRQHIPFADKLINKIAESGPVQALAQPLEQPIKEVGGLIDQVTDGASGVLDNAEQETGSFLGNGDKLLASLAGVTAAGVAAGKGAKGGKDDAKGGGGGFFANIKGGIHTRLLNFGKKLLQSGKDLFQAGVDKVKGVKKGPVVNFKIGSENHKLWVEQKGKRNVVMMASQEEEISKVVEGFEDNAANMEDSEGKVKKGIKNIKEHEAKAEANIEKSEPELKEAAKSINEVDQALGNSGNQNNTIKEFDVKPYGEFNKKRNKGDGLTGHELLQNAWLEAKGIISKRGSGLSLDNPAIALKEYPMHKYITSQQKSLGMNKSNLMNVTWQKNVADNIELMKQAGVPNDKIEELVSATRKFANDHKF
ncbi:MAG: hypothetical protein K6T85_00335 [Gorillibacterium sp.]|nr:hypothetical protein [Gorillibacterium sp.]